MEAQSPPSGVTGAGTPWGPRCWRSPGRRVLPVWAGRWWGRRCRGRPGQAPPPCSRNHTWRRRRGVQAPGQEETVPTATGAQFGDRDSLGVLSFLLLLTCNLRCSSSGPPAPVPPPWRPSPPRSPRCTACRHKEGVTTGREREGERERDGERERWWAWPGPSELHQQGSRPLQLDLVDRVVFVRVLVVPTAASSRPLPLAVDLHTGSVCVCVWETLSTFYR